MANKDTSVLIQGIIDVIKANGTKAITGNLVQTELINIVQSRGLIEVLVSTKTYLQNEFVSFNDTIYKCLSQVDPGETPVTDPGKFQVQGTSGGAPSNAIDITFTPGSSGLSSTNVDAAIKEVNTKTDDATITANNAETTANNAETTANNAETTADAAQADADTAQTTADAAQVAADAAQADADTAQTTADAAQVTADAAQADADTAQTTADNAETAAGNAQTTADGAVVTAGNAQTSASAAVATANNAQADATSALAGLAGKMDKVSGATDGNLASLNALGEAVDSGVDPNTIRALLPIDQTWDDEETGVVEVGDIGTDDVIEIRGFLKTGTVRSKVVITVTHNGTAAEVDYQMTPYRAQFQSVFPSAAINGTTIELSYNVGTLGAQLIFKGLIENFNI